VSNLATFNFKDTFYIKRLMIQSPKQGIIAEKGVILRY